MHVNADWAILEVVDEDNRPVPDGTKGAKVLITNLANYVQPIIRYEIGDIVTMATEPCDCGSSLPLVAGIDGRDSEMFWIGDDAEPRPLPPAVFEVALGEVIVAREYQLIQEDRNHFRVLIEPLPGAKFDQTRIDRLLRKQLEAHGLDGQLKLDIEAVDRLAPEGGDKFKRVVTKVEGPDGKPANKTAKRSNTNAQHRSAAAHLG
jgi:phenylacetate-coenzyme A ligase PaaK-like adenylate-forming protein